MVYGLQVLSHPSRLRKGVCSHNSVPQEEPRPDHLTDHVDWSGGDRSRESHRRPREARWRQDAQRAPAALRRLNDRRVSLVKDLRLLLQPGPARPRASHRQWPDQDGQAERFRRMREPPVPLLQGWVHDQGERHALGRGDRHRRCIEPALARPPDPPALPQVQLHATHAHHHHQQHQLCAG
jgi:hypothetical protein